MFTTTRAPRYLQLAEELKAMIVEGNLQPGDRMPAFSEMRARFDASPMTVDKMYAQLEKEGLVVREARRGCFVAGPKKKTKTGVLGLLGIQPDRRADHYFSQILGGVQQAAFAAGCEVMLLNSEVPVPWHKIDAMLLPSSDAATLLKGKPPSLPCVSLLYRYPHMAAVAADDFDGARQAAQALIDLGHRRIAFLTLADHPVTRLRVAGYQQALHDAAIDYSPNWLHLLDAAIDADHLFHDPLYASVRRWIHPTSNTSLKWSVIAGYDAMKQWLERDWAEQNCTALLTQNDYVALGALTALEERGLRVPHDVSLVGFDDLEICEYSTPPLSSVTVPLMEIGAAGVNMLLRRLDLDAERSCEIDDDNLNVNSTVLPTRFHARASTARVG